MTWAYIEWNPNEIEYFYLILQMSEYIKLRWNHTDKFATKGEKELLFLFYKLLIRLFINIYQYSIFPKMQYTISNLFNYYYRSVPLYFCLSSCSDMAPGAGPIHTWNFSSHLCTSVFGGGAQWWASWKVVEVGWDEEKRCCTEWCAIYSTCEYS